MINFLNRIWPKRWVATAVVVATILYLTLAPHPLPDDTPSFPGLDKIVHACMFGGLAFVACLDLARRDKNGFVTLSHGKRVTVLISTILFGGIIELAQGAMGLGRGADPLDFLADAVGVFIAVFIISKLEFK